MSTKNEIKLQQIEAWALGQGFSKDRFGNMKKSHNGKEYRLKFQALTIRYEVRTESGDWVRIRGGYIRDIWITPEGKIAGMRRGY